MTVRAASRTLGVALAIGLSVTACSASSPQAARHVQQNTAVSAAGMSAPRAKATPAPSSPVIATAAPDKYPGIKLAINSLTRDSAGVVTLTWTLTNSSQENFKANATTFNSIGQYAGDTVSDVTLLDSEHKVRYHTLRDEKSHYCVCTALSVTGAHSIIEPGHSATYYNAFTLPSNVTKITVEIPGFAGVKDLPIR